MPKDCVDLHCHSTASDGRLTPEQLVALAASSGLQALALTDHDTVAGLESFTRAGKSAGLETVPGVEISARYERGTMHIVGLFIDSRSLEFRAFLKQLADGRRARNPQIVAKLCALGFPLTMEEVEADAGIQEQGAGGGAFDKSIGRPHIAAVLIQKGYVKDKQEAFDRYLAKGRPAYVSRFAATPAESISQIHAAGGLAILAHPAYLQAKNEAELETLVRGLKDARLDGIEVYYSTHTPEQTACCARLAQKFGLAISGGSDFHGDDEGNREGLSVQLGSGIAGSLNLPYAVLEDLKARRKKRSG